MKKALPLLFVLLFAAAAYSQKAFVGASFDFNTSTSIQSTFALGFRMDARIGHSDWYLNWHNSLGGTVNADQYFRTNVMVILYRNPDYWFAATDVDHPLTGLLVATVMPVVCPDGVTWYGYHSPGRRLRIGGYVNPMQMDCWDLKHAPVSAWSCEFGCKMLYHLENQTDVLFSAGSFATLNMERYPGAGRYNEPHFALSIALLHQCKD